MLEPLRTVQPINEPLQHSHDIIRGNQAALLRSAVERQMLKRNREGSYAGNNC